MEIILPKRELEQLFPPGNFRLTETSLFSIAPPDHAAVTTMILKKFYSPRQLKNKIYVDGTSNVGGNVLPVIPIVKKLIAVEIDKTTSQLLRHNINEMYTNAKNVTVLNQDFVDFDFKKHSPDILFIDPPWGGKNYKELKDKEMYLSGKAMSKLLINIWAKYPDLIILRVPTKYPTKKLIPIDKMGFFKQVNLKTKNGRTIYKLLIFAKQKPQKRISGNITVTAVPYKLFHPEKV